MISGARSAPACPILLASLTVMSRADLPLIPRCGKLTPRHHSCMPHTDAVNLHAASAMTGGQNEGRRIETCRSCKPCVARRRYRRPRARWKAPSSRSSDVDWDAAAASLTDRAAEPPAEAFARLNAITDKRFAGIAKSTVPVLLPFDVDAFRKDVADGKAGGRRRRTNISAASIPRNSSCPGRPATTRPSRSQQARRSQHPF